jgi:DNA-binding Lrp family transcriptional regulator
LNFTAPKTAQVLDAISDEISFNIFKIIKDNAKDTQSIRVELNISAKQCYDRIAILLDTGLIKRKAGYYNITSFGRLIFQAQAKVAKAIENLWKLKMVDAIRSSDLSKNEYTKLVDELIDDDELKDMIVNNDIK